MYQYWKINGETVESQQKFDEKFKELTGLSQKEFEDSADDDAIFGHDLMFQKGNYRLVKNVYGLELSMIKEK